MTRLLKQAFEKASALPEPLQDQLARELIEEIEGESRWDEALAGSQEALDRLADKAAAQRQAGKTREMGCDEL
jgi:hypothetical protein